MNLHSPLANTAELLKKWSPVLEHKDVAPIKDAHRKEVTAQLLENQANEMVKEKRIVSESTTTGDVDYQDQVLIGLVRRAMPNMVAFDIASVQPLSGPTGLIFALKSVYGSGDNKGKEATMLNANEAHSGAATAGVTLPEGDPFAAESIHGGMSLATAEGHDGSFGEMTLNIGKAMVEAKTRALKASYTHELEQDMKATHGLNAGEELSNILTNEILAEMNREVFKSIYVSAKLGGDAGTGKVDMVNASDARWMAERFKSLLFRIEQDANAISRATLRGRGNILVVSADVASALSMSGMLDYTPALETELKMENPIENPFVGVLAGKFKVYVDPYAETNFYSVGYKGTDKYDAGLFYSPYVALQKYDLIDPATFQPKIGFKTRYALSMNPFSNPEGSVKVAARANDYYRITKVDGLITGETTAA